MPILNIRELGSVGVVSDIAPWDLPPSAFSDGLNFRLFSGKVQSTGGIEVVSPLAGRDIGHITQSTDLAGNSSWMVCGEDAILLYDGSNFYRLSGAGPFSVDYTKWTSAKIGNVTFLNNPEDYPMYWVDNNSATPDDVKYLEWHVLEETWEDVGVSCNIIRAHKNFLFALGINNAKGQFNDMLHWSHPAEPNGRPFSWRPTMEQPDSIAGSLSLGRGGAIVGGESLRDSFVIYSEEALNVMDFTGDALGWRRRAVSETAGLVNPHAIVEVKGAHMFFSGDDVLLYDGNSMRSLMHNRLRQRLASNINTSRSKAAWAAHYQSFGEVWFGVPESGADYANIAYCYNYKDDSWSIRSLESQIIHASCGREAKASSLLWDNANTSWASNAGSWNMAGSRPFQESMLGLSAQTINDLDPAVSTIDGGGVDESQLAWDGPNALPFGAFALDAWDDISEPWDDFEGFWDETPVVPKPPRGASAEAGDGEALVRWFPPESDGGSPVTKYTVTSSPGGFQETTAPTETSCLITGLSNGTEYSFTVTAHNKEGISDPSQPTNLVTPVAGNTTPEPPDSFRSWDSFSSSWDQASAGGAYRAGSTWLQRTGLPIGGHETSTTITRIYPHVEGTSPIKIRVGSQQHAGGPVSWAGGFREFHPGKDRKIDVRTTGELHAYEVRSSEGTFKLTGMDIEFKMAGGR